MSKNSTTSKAPSAPEGGKAPKGADANKTAADTSLKGDDPKPTGNPLKGEEANLGNTPNPADGRVHTDTAQARPDQQIERNLGDNPQSMPNAGMGSTDQPGEGTRDPENAARMRDEQNPPITREPSGPSTKHPNDPLLHVENETRANPVEGGPDLPGEAAAKATANLPPNNQPLVANAPVDPLSPAGAFPNEETRTMISPRPFFVLLNDGRRVSFKKGPQEVPTSLQEHHYVKSHQVEPYDPAPAYKKKPA